MRRGLPRLLEVEVDGGQGGRQSVVNSSQVSYPRIPSWSGTRRPSSCSACRASAACQPLPQTGRFRPRGSTTAIAGGVFVRHCGLHPKSDCRHRGLGRRDDGAGVVSKPDRRSTHGVPWAAWARRRARGTIHHGRAGGPWRLTGVTGHRDPADPISRFGCDEPGVPAAGRIHPCSLEVRDGNSPYLAPPRARAVRL